MEKNIVITISNGLIGALARHIGQWRKKSNHRTAKKTRPAFPRGALNIC